MVLSTSSGSGYRALTLFSSFRDIPDYESSDPFRGHAIHVFFTIEKAVKMLGDLENLVPVLERLGKRHVGTFHNWRRM